MNDTFKSPAELKIDLGVAVRSLRIGRSMTQREVATKADVALRSVVELEAGRGSTLDTFVRVLKAIGAADVIAQLVPKARISPIAMLKSPKVRRRVRHARTPKTNSP